MNDFCIKITSEEQGAQIQKILFDKGYSWFTGDKVWHPSNTMPYYLHFKLNRNSMSWWSINRDSKELSLPELEIVLGVATDLAKTLFDGTKLENLNERIKQKLPRS